MRAGGDSKEIQKQIELLKRQIADSTSDYDREKLEERLAKLSGGIGIIRVGAATEVEMHEKKDRVDDALQATKAAVEEGILSGGGSAFVHCVPVLKKLISGLKGSKKVGAEIIIKAISYPLRQIAENAGQEGSIVVQKVMGMKANEGWNALTNEYGNLLDMGVIDPTKVTRLTLELAASIASLLLTTEAIITDEPSEQKAAPEMAGAGGMGY